MLKFVDSAATALCATARRVATTLRAAKDRREERVVLARLMNGDDHLLSDIGLTREDVAALLRKNQDGFSPALWSAGPQRAASASL
jgi:uncharacterized protein YjiS (DUF1127 family)